MNALGDQTALSEKSIWIVDDEIPVYAANFDHDDMLNGSRPIDRGTLLSLLMVEDDYWADKAVLELCKELVKEKGEIKAFLLPTGPVEYLSKGGKAPDIIIFDMDYQAMKDKDKVLEYLELLLKNCISVIQIYTKEALEEIAPNLEPLSKKYSTRLQQPKLKTDTNAKSLEEIVFKKLESSLSAHLATNIRRLSAIAIESVLVEIDNLPINVAIRLLAGRDDEVQDVELVELLSIKVGDFLKSSPDLANAIKQYGKGLGVSSDREKQFIDETTELFATVVRNRIQYDKWLYEAIQTTNQLAQGSQTDEETKRIVKEFFSFRVYDQPGDDWVRTGDIVSLGSDIKIENGEFPDLYIILTPACDLARFWSKTRGVLTLAKMHPLIAGKGIERIKNYGNKYEGNPSITAKNPFILPSILFDGHTRMDYGLFFHEIESRKLDITVLVAGKTDEQKSKQYKHQLTYSNLQQMGEKARRYCRISEPFLSGVLAEISSLMFRSGVPDFPEEEMKRLKGIF